MCKSVISLVAIFLLFSVGVNQILAQATQFSQINTVATTIQLECGNSPAEIDITSGTNNMIIGMTSNAIGNIEVNGMAVIEVMTVPATYGTLTIWFYALGDATGIQSITYVCDGGGGGIISAFENVNQDLPISGIESDTSTMMLTSSTLSLSTPLDGALYDFLILLGYASSTDADQCSNVNFTAANSIYCISQESGGGTYQVLSASLNNGSGGTVAGIGSDKRIIGRSSSITRVFNAAPNVNHTLLALSPVPLMTVPATPPTAIPTLSEWALIILGISLSIFGIVGIKRSIVQLS